MGVKYFALLVLLAGMAFAVLTIPATQPICKLYSIIQIFGTIGGVLVAAYAGLILASSNDINERNKSKQLISGVIIGLIVIWVAPLVVKELVSATSVCGW